MIEEIICPGPHGGAPAEECDTPRRVCGEPSTQTLILVGGPFDVEPTPVDHCDKCTEHWRRHHPERIQGES